MPRRGRRDRLPRLRLALPLLAVAIWVYGPFAAPAGAAPAVRLAVEANATIESSTPAPPLATAAGASEGAADSNVHAAAIAATNSTDSPSTAAAPVPPLTTAPAASDGDGTSSAKAGKMSAGEMFRDARSRRPRISGLHEFFEWALVFVLIAPGTFPAMSCVILACAAFWRRQSRAIWPGVRAHGSSPSLSSLEAGGGGDAAPDLCDQPRTRRRTGASDDVAPPPQGVPLLSGAAAVAGLTGGARPAI
jgi:hypothetical protein